MLSEISNASETERSFDVFPEFFSWSELTLAPTDFQFGPRETKPSLMIVKHTNLPSQSHIQTNSVFDEIDVSAFIIQCAVKGAVYLKSTSIPDKITDTVETVVEFSSVMEQHYAIKAKVKEMGHVFVSALINIVTTLIAATLQFIIAYHNAPGRVSDQNKHGEECNRLYLQGRTRPEIVDLDSTLITFSVGGQLFTTKLEHVLPRKRTLLGKKAMSRTSLSDPVFLDRDPTHFRHVVNFLRGASSISHIRDQQILDELLDEAHFYEMDDLMEAVLLRKSELQ